LNNAAPRRVEFKAASREVAKRRKRVALRHRHAVIRIPQIMSKSARLSPRCIIIAGPNGAGKTTFAREFLSKEVGVVHFVNPDLIASGLSPLRPELAALAAGRLFLLQLDRLARSKDDFAFESTLSGLTYLNRLKRWKAAGWRIEIVYLRISSPRLALRRISARVKQGGHNVPRRDVVRRFARSRSNFEKHYRLLADAWSVYDNSGNTPKLLERSQ
jgi:predicted ABC-type ATPase